MTVKTLWNRLAIERLHHVGSWCILVVWHWRHWATFTPLSRCVQVKVSLKYWNDWLSCRCFLNLSSAVVDVCQSYMVYACLQWHCQSQAHDASVKYLCISSSDMSSEEPKHVCKPLLLRAVSHEHIWFPSSELRNYARYPFFSFGHIYHPECFRSLNLTLIFVTHTVFSSEYFIFI